MNDFLSETWLFGIVFTIAAFWFFTWLSRRVGSSLLSPMLFASALIIAVLKLTGITYDTYMVSAKFLDYLITPAVTALAVPLYRQLDTLKENAASILLGSLAGTLAALISVTVICAIFGVSDEIFSSLLPKSVTAGVSKEITAELGGNVPLTLIAVALAGNTGAAFCRFIPKWFGIHDEVSWGIAMGTGSHVLGTSAVMQDSETAGAMSSLSLTIAAVMSVILCPVFALIY